MISSVINAMTTFPIPRHLPASLLIIKLHANVKFNHAMSRPTAGDKPEEPVLRDAFGETVFLPPMTTLP